MLQTSNMFASVVLVKQKQRNLKMSNYIQDVVSENINLFEAFLRRFDAEACPEAKLVARIISNGLEERYVVPEKCNYVELSGEDWFSTDVAEDYCNLIGMNIEYVKRLVKVVDKRLGLC